jgi:5S rRNA maturation endonuclease (ribonuclease M5)
MAQTNLYEKDDLVFLKESVDVHYLLDQLGIPYIKSNAKEIRGPCSIHGGDNRSAFRFNIEKRTWVCFTHKCHEEYGNDIIGLIKAALKVDFKAALDFLKDLVGDVDGATLTASKRQHEKERKAFIEAHVDPTPPEYVSEQHLKLFKPFRSSFFTQPINGDFKITTLDHFEVGGGFMDGYNIQRDVIPIRDVNNKLVAYSLRDITGNILGKDYKYVLTKPFNKDKVLYNLNNARIYGPTVPLIVVEGFKTVWRFYEYGFFNTVAVMGSCVTIGQAKLLKAYALKGVVLMFDPDKAGKAGVSLSKKLLGGGIAIHEVNMLPEEGEDPADLTFEQAYHYLHEYIG